MDRTGSVGVLHEFKQKMDEGFLVKDFQSSKMSNAFNMAMKTFPEHHPINLPLSPSPDSNSGAYTTSDRESDSSPDISMLYCFLSSSSAAQTPDIATAPQANDNASTNLNDARSFWHDNLSADAGAAGNDPTSFANISEGTRSAASHLHTTWTRILEESSEVSHPESTDVESFSISSGEMVVRANSFSQAEQSLGVLSPLEEPLMPSPEGQLLPETDPPDSILMEPDECLENHCAITAGLGRTFIQSELPSEENIPPTPNSEAAQRKKGGLMSTFCCETPTDCVSESFSPSTGSWFAVFGALTPGPVNPCGTTLFSVPDQDICTSTPLHHVGYGVPRPLSLTESPCIGDEVSSGLQTIQEPQNSAPPQDLAAEMPPSTGKVKKMEIKKFPKADFSNIKSKVVTRSVSACGSASQRRSQVHQDRKHTEHGVAAGVIPAKMKSSVMAQSAAQSRPGSSYAESPVSGQVADAAEQRAANQTFCFSSPEKSHVGSGQTDPKPTPKKSTLNKIQVRPGPVLAQDKRPPLRTRPRCTSESSTSSLRTPQKSRATPGTHPGQNTAGRLNHFSCATPKDPGAIKRTSLVAESCRSSTAAASCDEGKNGLRANESPRQTRGAHSSRAAAASPRPAALSTRARDESTISKPARTPLHKRSATGGQRAQAAGEPSLGSALASSIKSHLSRSRPPHTPSRLPLPGSTFKTPSTPARKSLGPARRLTEASVNTKHSDGAAGSSVSGGAARKPSPFKSAVLGPRFITTPTKTTGLSLATACKPVSSTGKGAARSAVTPLKSTSARPAARTTNVDKNKPRTGSRQQPAQQQASQPSQGGAPPDVVPARTGGGRGGGQEQSIQQLQRLLAAGNCRFEAVAIVLQHALAERDEATRQCRDLSQELVTLRGELVSSVHSSERLQKEKDELRVALEEAVQQLQEQHQKDLAELEQRLQTFYQAEWDKVHLSYQEEADKCKALMQQQMDELKANHDTMKLELESSHTEQLQCVKQQYELSLEELTKVHHQELETLDKTLRDAEASLSGQIEALTAENKALTEKLREEETRRKELAEASQDSHTLYLEQELESLKVVLDLKNEQLHQQEKKLMEVDKLKEKNVKLDETLKKVLQQNEDLKARMDKHAALSKQLSSEQAVLQESLQKESKVNKRLSMENEELLWKLHNGDPSSPRRASPTSTPSHAFTLQAPRSPGAFSSPPVSPR